MAGWFNTAVPTGMAQVIEKSSPLKALSHGMSELNDIVDNRVKEKYTTSALESLKSAKSMQDVLNLGLDTSKMTDAGYKQYNQNINMIRNIGEEQRAIDRLNLAKSQEQRALDRFALEQSKDARKEFTDQALADKMTMKPSEWNAKYSNAGGLNALRIYNYEQAKKDKEFSQNMEIKNYNLRNSELSFNQNMREENQQINILKNKADIVKDKMTTMSNDYKIAQDIITQVSADPSSPRYKKALEVIGQMEELRKEYNNSLTGLDKLYNSMVNGAITPTTPTISSTPRINISSDNVSQQPSVPTAPVAYNTSVDTPLTDSIFPKIDLSTGSTTSPVTTPVTTNATPTEVRTSNVTTNSTYQAKPEAGKYQMSIPNSQIKFNSSGDLNTDMGNLKNISKKLSTSSNKHDKENKIALDNYINELKTVNKYVSSPESFRSAMSNWYEKEYKNPLDPDSVDRLVNKTMSKVASAVANTQANTPQGRGIKELIINEVQNGLSKSQSKTFFNEVMPTYVGAFLHKEGRYPTEAEIFDELNKYSDVEEGSFRLPFTATDYTYTSTSLIGQAIKDVYTQKYLKESNQRSESDKHSSLKVKRNTYSEYLYGMQEQNPEKYTNEYILNKLKKWDINHNY